MDILDKMLVLILGIMITHGLVNIAEKISQVTAVLQEISNHLSR